MLKYGTACQMAEEAGSAVVILLPLATTQCAPLLVALPHLILQILVLELVACPRAVSASDP